MGNHRETGDAVIHSASESMPLTGYAIGVILFVVAIFITFVIESNTKR